MTRRVRVNPITCDAHGLCAEMLPELIRLDDWGYPILDESEVPPDLLGVAAAGSRRVPDAGAVARQRLVVVGRGVSALRTAGTWRRVCATNGGHLEWGGRGRQGAERRRRPNLSLETCIARQSVRPHGALPCHACPTCITHGTA